MSTKAHVDHWRRSVAVRLSAWFALLFALGVFTIFALLYWLLGRQLEQRDYEALQLRLRQYASLYANGGLDGLRVRVAEDSEGPRVRSLFIRLVGPTGSAVWGKIPPDWIEADTHRIELPSAWGGYTERRVYKLRIPRDEERDLIVVSQALPDGLLLQVGRSSDSRALLLAPLRRAFLWVAAPVVFACFVAGYLTARRATRPLQGVVDTARRIIATGTLEARVTAPTGDDEMAELVRLFNTMLDKNAGLLRSMREALDNVAHDLRTPLTSLRGTAELALRAPDRAGTHEALAECVERSDEVLRLLRALMEISEAEAGMLRLEKAPTDLGALARGAADLYREIAEARGQTLTLIEGPPVPVLADATRLRQAIANLIDNALKYSPDGGRVTISTRLAGEAAALEVRDSGPGVPEAEQARIWERLYRSDQSRSQSGLGLGLSLVRAIVEAHGGKAAMFNDPAGGAVFSLNLPRATPPGQA